MNSAHRVALVAAITGGLCAGGPVPAQAAPVELDPGASYLGQSDYDEAGYRVAAAGDVNGDGLDDLLISAPDSDVPLVNAGQTYLVLGRTQGWQLDLSLGTADGSFVGEESNDYASYAACGAGDLDGDGYDDIAIGAYGNGESATDAGKVYLVFGDPVGWPLQTPLADAAATFLGEELDDRAGYSLAAVGDVDGDGYDDLAVGAYKSNDGVYHGGEVYLVQGMPQGGWAVGADLGALSSSFVGEVDSDFAGKAVGGGGDVNGDGFDDLLVGAPNNDETAAAAGKVYLILGQGAGWAADTPLADADATFRGESDGAYAGRAVDIVGDVNGDGLDDLLIGSYGRDYPGSDAGEVYLVFGGPGIVDLHVSLDQADASFSGEMAGDFAGWSASGAGDVDGDGYDDVLVGAYKWDGDELDSGATYLLLGRPSDWSLRTPLSMAGAAVFGEAAYDYLGRSCAGLGDVDGDGFDDLLVGVSGNDEFDTDAGKALLIFGEANEDVDGDGYTTWGGDCDDLDPDTHPGAEDDPCDGWDTDCDDFLDEITDLDGDGYTHCDGDCDDLDPTLDLADLDGDGFTTCGGECDDTDPTVHPGAEDVFCDGVDSACDGSLPQEIDGDLDGYAVCDGDCDDDSYDTFPGAVELCDHQDNDCDGQIPGIEHDGDGDGQTECEGDCDDFNEFTYLGALELCDGHDNDCDGIPDDNEVDDDGDGVTECEGDCDDGNPDRYPGAPETCADGVDSDCSGDIWAEFDDDNDGWAECQGDCNDSIASIHPGATEVCNGIDDDCTPLTDEDGDADGDGVSLCGGDCDEEDPGTYPGAPEACDGKDNDCNGYPDDGFDQDGDGASSCGGGDCDDGDPTIRPGVPEVPYDGIDQDCDGEDMVDVDGDGFAGGERGDDCDDTQVWISPGAPEICSDGVDGDCDGIADADDPDCAPAACAVAGTTSVRLASDRSSRWAPTGLVLLAALFVRRRRR